MNLEYFFLVAEAREVKPLLRLCKQVTPRFFQGTINQKSFAIGIMGVGKKSVKLSIRNFKSDGIHANNWINLGNAGALQDHFRGTIFQIGTVFYNNGRDHIIIDKNSSVSLITLNSIRQKQEIINQFKNINLVDMELAVVLKELPGNKVSSYKIVLDKFSETPMRKGIFWSFRIKSNARILSSFVLKKFLA